jgi:thiol:disulfide interchange protein
VVKNAVIITLSAAIGLAAAVGVSTVMSGPAETPPVLTEIAGLSAAKSKAQAEGKPVVAFVTADWCPPCQMMKKTTLKDERVAAFLGNQAVTVALWDGQDDADIRSLPVEAFPTTLVIRGDEVVAKAVGYMGANEYLGWLNTATSGG